MGAPGPDLLVGKIRFEAEGLRELIRSVRAGLGGSIEEVDKKIAEFRQKLLDIDPDLQQQVLSKEDRQELTKSFKGIEKEYRDLQFNIRKEAKETADRRIQEAQRAAAAQQKLLLKISGALAAAAAETINQVTEGVLNDESTQEILERVRDVATGLAAGLGAILAGPIGAAIGAAGARAASALADFVASRADRSEEFARSPLDQEVLDRYNEATEKQNRINKAVIEERKIREGTADELERAVEKQEEIRKLEEDRRRILRNAGVTEIGRLEETVKNTVDLTAIEERRLEIAKEIEELKRKEVSGRAEIAERLLGIIELENESIRLNTERQNVIEKAQQRATSVTAELARSGVDQRDIFAFRDIALVLQEEFGAPLEKSVRTLAQLSERQGTATGAIAALENLIPGISSQIAERGGSNIEEVRRRAQEFGDTAQGALLRDEFFSLFLGLVGEARGRFDPTVSPEGRAGQELARQARGIEIQVEQQKETIKTIEDQIRVTEKQLEEEQETQRTTVQPLEQAARAFQLAGLGSQEQLLKDQLSQQRRLVEEADKQRQKLEEEARFLDNIATSSRATAAAVGKIAEKGVTATVGAGQ